MAVSPETIPVFKLWVFRFWVVQKIEKINGATY